MKKYNVAIWEEIGTRYTIEAKNEQEAEDKIKELLEDGEDMKEFYPKIVHEDYGVADVDEV